jgi:hypothetical protein
MDAYGGRVWASPSHQHRYSIVHGLYCLRPLREGWWWSVEGLIGQTLVFGHKRQHHSCADTVPGGGGGCRSNSSRKCRLRQKGCVVEQILMSGRVRRLSQGITSAPTEVQDGA